MLSIPSKLQTQFEACLRKNVVPTHAHGLYKKWLRYYRDFCQKYDFPQEHQESLPHFLKKLQDKKQTTAQQEQAAHAISLYYELLDSKPAVPASKLSEGKSLEGNSTRIAALTTNKAMPKPVRTGRAVSWETDVPQDTFGFLNAR